MPPRYLTALPVFNEAKCVDPVLNEVLRYSENVLVVNDGSTDGTTEILRRRNDIRVLDHPYNRGYGAALHSAFEFAKLHDYEFIVTIDCDGQHEPQRIPRLVRACEHVDIVSGSRYLKQYAGDSPPPEDRRQINRLVTDQLNKRLGLRLTDAFCGFKAYRVAAISQLELRETGYAMPLELWVQAAFHRLRIVELAVPLIYLDEDRSFGGPLDDADTRLAYYYEILDRSVEACRLSEQQCLAHSCGGYVG